MRYRLDRSVLTEFAAVFVVDVSKVSHGPAECRLLGEGTGVFSSSVAEYSRM